MTVDSFFKAFKEAPGKLLSRFGVGAPEEIEMDSVEVNIFENPHYSYHVFSKSQRFFLRHLLESLL
jgi:hypothetical protein